jgi:GNAT superfamily N-acetyltransferase
MKPVARPAESPEEALAGLSVRHEAYRRKVPLLESQARRLGARREHRSTPWVLDRGDGTVVATLLVHPIVLALYDAVLPAYGIGSVGTRDAERRRGHATALVRAACEANEARGRAVGLLFASVPPPLYERCGFVVAPAHAFETKGLQDLADGGPAATLVPVDPRREADRLAAAWTDAHRGVLHVRRDAAAFLESVEDAADDLFFAIREDGGYVRAHAESKEAPLEVAEVAWLDPATEAPALRALARLALDGGRPGLEGWLPPTPFVRSSFEEASRAEDLPMLRGAPPHAASRFFPPDHF